MKHGNIPDKMIKGTVSVPDRLSMLDKIQPHAVLATEYGGQPYTSLIAYALTPDTKGLIFITPRSTRKYTNILKNERVSLLIDTRKNTPEDYLSAESITILGKAHPVRKGTQWERLIRVFTEKHSRLGKVTDSPKTALILVEISTCIHVTQFQSVTIWEVS
jgi:nitroimidazol reductase NimA-like FMN-containing flavoprotein (pyridoxamine 5'-phosphate oxidase superfamily)